MTEPALEALLDVQRLDLSLEQLRHRRATLASRRDQQAAEREAADIDRRLGPVRETGAVLARSAKRLEDEVASLEAKASDVDRRLYSGNVNAPRELQAMQDDIASLRRRVRQLEDELLEVMEQAEPVGEEEGRLVEQRTALEAEAARQAAAAEGSEAEIDAEIATVGGRRAELVVGVPPDLLAEYERLRARLGGEGVARLDGNRCTGCHLTLPAKEVEAVRRAPSGSVPHHEECGRILVPS
jgi:uncharacterized protein